MNDESRPWPVPVVVFACIVAVGVGSVVLSHMGPGTPGSYPERPDTLGQSNVVDFTVDYERAYAREELSRRYAVDQFDFDISNRTILGQTEDGYAVHLAVVLRWSSEQVEGDRRYVANYFVNSSVVRRAEAHGDVYPGPDARLNGTTLDG